MHLNETQSIPSDPDSRSTCMYTNMHHTHLKKNDGFSYSKNIAEL
jgi:hypothetical protein